MSYPTTRVLTLLELLQSGRSYTGPELARRLDVDVRTVRRYAERLTEIGVPVAAARGRHGGYRILPGYKLPPMMFTDAEAVAVVLGLRVARRLGLATVEDAADLAAAKIRRVLPDALRGRVDALAAAVEVDRAAGRTAPAAAPVLLTLSEAVADHRRVRIDYRSWRGADSERDLDPYGVVFHSGRWYATGHDGLRDRIGTFRLDRIVSARLTGERFDPPAGFDPAGHLAAALAAVPYRWECEVLLDTTLAEARARIPRSVGESVETAAGVVLRTRAERLDGMAAMLAGLGWPFTIRRPAELRDAVRALAERLHACAGEGGPSASD